MNFVNSKTFFKNVEHNLDSIILIDTRSYLAYNEDHILHACNMYCPPILKRRVRNGGTILLKSMLGCEIQNKLKSNEIDTIYMYDDGTYLLTHDEMSDLFIVWTSMCKLIDSKQCYILQSKYKQIPYKQQLHFLMFFLICFSLFVVLFFFVGGGGVFYLNYCHQDSA